MLLVLVLSAILAFSWFSEKIWSIQFHLTAQQADITISALVICAVLDVLLRLLSKAAPLSVGYNGEGFAKLKQLFESSDCAHCLGKGLCNCKACEYNGPEIASSSSKPNIGRMLRSSGHGNFHKCSCCSGSGKAAKSQVEQNIDFSGETLSESELENLEEATQLALKRIDAEASFLDKRKDIELLILDRKIELERLKAKVPTQPFSLRWFLFGK